MTDRPPPRPVVSVIVPLHNCVALSRAMLASLDTTWPAGITREVILVDDGSSDGTGAWLDGLGGEGIRILRHDRCEGYASANHRGVAAARGEFLALLNNDLVLETGWLEPLLAVHRRLGSRAGVIGNVQRRVADGAVDHAGIVINARGLPEHRRDRPAIRRFLPGAHAFLPTPAVTGACLLVRRSLWDDLGGFDRRYRNGCEDVDLCFRAAAFGRLNGVALRSVVSHHVSASPGRRDHDAANTLALVIRWRARLIDLGARAWCREFLARAWAGPRQPDRAGSALAILAHAVGLTATPPPAARAAVEARLAEQVAHWRNAGVAAPVPGAAVT